MAVFVCLVPVSSCSLAGCMQDNTCTLLTYSTAKSKCSTGEQMKARLLNMTKQLDAVWVQVDEHGETRSGKEEENGEGQGGKERQRPRW